MLINRKKQSRKSFGGQPVFEKIKIGPPKKLLIGRGGVGIAEESVAPLPNISVEIVPHILPGVTMPP